MEPYSVLISVYSRELPEHLSLAIESMIGQTEKPNEIIIVEDGPLTKDLNAVVERYERTFPNLFTIVKEDKNVGLGLALNHGLNVSRNELVARMDSDDISKPDRCEKQLKVFEKNANLAIVGAWVDEFDVSTEDILSTRFVPEDTDSIYEFCKRRSAFNHPVVMYKKSKVLEVGGYSDLRRNQDVDLFGRMLFAGSEAYNLQESLLFFRVGKDLFKRRKSWDNSRSYIKTIKKFWKMGYSSFFDYLSVSISQIIIFLLPPFLQKWLYKLLLRGKPNAKRKAIR